MKKYTKERHIVFQEADVTAILLDYLKKNGETNIPSSDDEIEFSFDKYKHGNEITLMFDEPDELEPQFSFFSFPTKLEDMEAMEVEKVELSELRWPDEGPIMIKEGEVKKGTNHPGGSYPGNIGGVK